MNDDLGSLRILRPEPTLPKGGRTANKQHSGSRVRREETRRLRQGCQRPDRFERRGKTTPALRSEMIRRSGLGRREPSGPPKKLHGAQDSVSVTAAKVAGEHRERARCGCTQFGWMADVGWTYRAPFPPRDRKISWFREALVGTRSVAPPDAERGVREDETVRVGLDSTKCF